MGPVKRSNIPITGIQEREERENTLSSRFERKAKRTQEAKHLTSAFRFSVVCKQGHSLDLEQ